MLNQIASRVNSTNHIYEEDMKEIKEMMEQEKIKESPGLKRWAAVENLLYLIILLTEKQKIRTVISANMKLKGYLEKDRGKNTQKKDAPLL